MDAADGLQLWKRNTGGPVPSTPAAVDDLVYVGSYDGKFYAFDARTGTTRWKFATEASGSCAITSPAATQGKVIAGTADSSLFLIFDAGSRKKLVKKPGKAFVFASPSVAGNIDYVGVRNGTLEARDLDSDDVLWEFQTELSKRNAGRVLTEDRTFNAPLLYGSK